MFSISRSMNGTGKPNKMSREPLLQTHLKLIVRIEVSFYWVNHKYIWVERKR